MNVSVTEENVLGQIPAVEADWALKAGTSNGELVNATGLLADDLEEYAGGLTEIQTLILACVATVIPLFLGLLLVLGVRIVWKKYKNHNANAGYDNDGLRREDSCDAVKSSSFMQSAEELKTSESQYSVLMPEDVGITAAAAADACYYATGDGTMAQLPPPLVYHSPPNNRFGDTNKTNLNGSIITLTMKNNHLIVETEERVPGVCMAEAAIAEGSEKSYEYDDDEFDMEAEMLRREFREASLLANGSGGGGCCSHGSAAAVLEPSSETQVDLTADRRPTAAPVPAAAVQPLQPATGDHSSGGSSSVDSRVTEMAYAYGNQSEYAAVDVVGKQCAKGGKSIASAGANNNNNNNNNNNDDEYLVEQRLLGNGADGTGSVTSSTGATDGGSPPQPLPDVNSRSLEDSVAAAAIASSAAQ